MTWGQFKTLIRVYLPSHGRREGIQVLLDQYIKAATIDLLETIDALRGDVKRTLKTANFTTDGAAGRAHIPAGAVLLTAVNRDPEDVSRVYEYRFAESEDERRRMIDGLTISGQRWISLDPATGTIRVVPNPKEDGSEVVVTWRNATCADFEDDDEVSFGEREAEAVSEFVLARLARLVDNDIQMADRHAASYVRLKRLLYVKSLEVARFTGRAK